MPSFSRLCVLAVSLALLFHASLGAKVSWSVYSSNACNGTTVLSDSDSGAQASGSNYISGCRATSGLTGVGSAQFYCTTVIPTGVNFFTDSNCATPSTTALSSPGGGSGQCFGLNGIANAQSASVTCSNGAFATAALSLPLLALLALLATIVA